MRAEENGCVSNVEGDVVEEFVVVGVKFIWDDNFQTLLSRNQHH
jgi:hypothetical protein